MTPVVLRLAIVKASSIADSNKVTTIGMTPHRRAERGLVTCGEILLAPHPASRARQRAASATSFV
jgi:hypothetical protein